MRILFLTSRLPYPPHRGDRVRTFNFLKAFASRHDVHLVSFIESDAEREAAAELKGICSRELVVLGKRRSLLNIATHALSPMPYQALYYRSAEMQAVVQAAFADGTFDLIYVHLFRMAPFIVPLLGRRPSGGGSDVRAVLDLTDSVASEIELSIRHRAALTRFPYMWESRKIRAYETRVMPGFDETWVISEADRDDVLLGASGARVEIVPNGVDDRLFELDPSMSDSGEVVFVGNLSVPHNIDAVEFLIGDVMPRLRAAEPGATLRVVGKGAGDRVRCICDAADWCTLTGFVPDLRDAYRNAAVFAAPLRFAAGVQNKMLEAMAAGVPVVTTPTGNRGLQAAPGSEIVVASGGAEFACALGEVLSDARRRDALSKAGRRFISGRFSWSHALERAEAVGARSRR
ncbi:glycosyltransferase [bacterium]|nr:glycosyltransferase [bacterium]